MAVMTGALHDSLMDVVPIQRDRRARRPLTPVPPPAVVRICSDSPLGAQLLMPAASAAPPIASLLPIQRDRRARRARRGSNRRMTVLAVAFGVSMLMWVAIIGGVLGLAHTL
jgi:hypothetical protein